MTRFGIAKPARPRILDAARLLAAMRSSGLASSALAAAALLAAYVLLEWISFIHEFQGLPVTPWNPGLGLMFALMVFAGPRGALVLFVGSLCAELFLLQSDLAWPVIATLSALTAASYACVAEVLRRHLNFDAGLTHLRDVLLLLAAGLAGAAMSAIFLAATLVLSGELASRDVVHASLPLLVGDVIGIAVMAPLLLRFLFHRSGTAAFARLVALAPEGAVHVAIIAAGLAVVTATESTGGFSFFYVLFLPVVIAAVRHGLDGACLGLAVTQFGLVALVHIYDYDARAFTELQALMFVLTATGLIVGVIVSERRNSEHRVREAEARIKDKEAIAAQAARFNLVSGLTSSLAHEINQPMTAARALARSAQAILQTPGGDLARAGNNLAGLIAHIDHASAVVRRMREFLRRGRLDVGPIALPGMIEEALNLIRAEAAAHRIRILLDAPDSLPVVQGDRVQLEQVVLNLVRNAIEAIAASERGHGSVRIVARALDGPGRVEIGVIDDGPGIAEEIASRLFDPLTTSKQEGLGLGLPICMSIVESHGGRLWLQSRAAGAAEFRFSLPLETPGA